MKRLFITTITICLSLQSMAQDFDTSNLRVGLGLLYATEIDNIGININSAYAINEDWEAAISIAHIFEKDYVNWNVLDLDGHYVFYHGESSINAYGLAGFSFNFWKVKIPASEYMGVQIPEVTDSGTEIGFNLGVGLNYAISERINLAPEIRYTIMDGSYLRLGAAVQCMF